MINFTVTGDDRVLAYLSARVPAITQSTRASMGRIVVRLTRYVKAEKLSGQVLKNRTGTLRRKINGRVTEEAGTLTGSVGVKLAYAAAHEYGFDGAEQVRAHLRTIKQAFGREIAVKQVQVRSFERHVHIPERSFLRSSLRELRPQIMAELDAAVTGGLA